MKKLVILTTVWIILTGSVYGQKYDLFSPDKKINVVVEISERILYSVYDGPDLLVEPSPLSMTDRAGQM